MKTFRFRFKTIQNLVSFFSGRGNPSINLPVLVDSQTKGLGLFWDGLGFFNILTDDKGMFYIQY